MKKTTAAVTGAIALTSASLALGAGSAQAAGTPTAQDKTFIVSNAQSNLAEITLGKLGLTKAQTSATKELAAVTMKDHVALQAKLASVAKTAGVTLPTAPNAMQRQTAATLSATPASAFDLAFAKAQVLGHKLAIAAAQKETSAGAAPTVTSYATGYIPVATMHLNMATSDVSALSTSSPTAVSAGTGGQAATNGSGHGWELGLGAGVALVVVSGAAAARRRSAASI